MSTAALDDVAVKEAMQQAMQAPTSKPSLARNQASSSSSGCCSRATSTSKKPATTVDDEVAKQKARELESELQMRQRKIEEEQVRLQQIQKMVTEMEGPQRHGIEQLRQEITRIHSELQRWLIAKRDAESALEASKAELVAAQETKRRLSERLFDMLMDSEEMRSEKLSGEMTSQ